MKFIDMLANWEWWPTFRRYVQFCVVGGSGVSVDMGIIWLLADPKLLGWNLTLSKVIAAEVAIFNNFLWNDVWTFRGLGVERSHWRRLIRFGKFNLICTAGIILSVMLLNVQVYWLGVNVYLANFLSIVAVSFWNFFMNLKLGWNNPTKSEGRARCPHHAEHEATSWRGSRQAEDSPPYREVQAEENSEAAKTSPLR